MAPLVAEAAGRGADLVLLPEKWNAWMDGPRLRPLAERIDGGETVDAMAGWARDAPDQPHRRLDRDPRRRRRASTTSRSRSTASANRVARLHQDPPVRRRRRRVQLPRIRRHGARVRPRHGGARRRHGRPDGLLRPALPRALPGAHARPRRADSHDPVELHAPHGHGALGGAAAGTGDREPGLRARHRPARDCRAGSTSRATATR